MEIKLELDIDQQTDLVRNALIEDVKLIYELGADEYEYQTLEALWTVIEYYSTREQFDEFWLWKVKNLDKIE